MNALRRMLVVGLVLAGIAGAAPTILKLNDGSVIKGDISSTSPTATEVVVSTDYGVRGNELRVVTTNRRFRAYRNTIVQFF